MPFKKLTDAGYDLVYKNHAGAILKMDFEQAIADIEEVLDGFTIDQQEFIAGGGGEASITQRMRGLFTDSNWKKREFNAVKTIDGVVTESTSHEVDHVKTFKVDSLGGEKKTIALEIEWNNKDPFYDRDLENFKRLHADNAISLGIIVTRGESLQSELFNIILDYGNRNDIDSFDKLTEMGFSLTPRQKKNIKKTFQVNGDFTYSWAHNFFKDKYGQATTHWNKLKARMERGVGSPCPFIGIGLPATIVSYPER